MTRGEMFTSPAALVSFVIMTVASVLATSGAHPVGMVMMIAIGLTLTAITIDSGGHSMLMMSAVFLMVALGIAIDTAGLDGALPWAATGVVALVYGDAVRLCFAERRHGVIEAGVYRGVFIGLGIVVVGSGVTAAVVAGLADATANANWLLVPLALALVTVGLVGMAIAVSRSPGQFDKRRWKPGERLMAPPRAASDDPSLESSTPASPAPPRGPSTSGLPPPGS